MMLKLFQSVECDNQAMAQSELVAALRQAAKLPEASAEKQGTGQQGKTMVASSQSL